MKNLQSNFLGRFVTRTDDTTNQLYSVVAVWLPEQSASTLTGFPVTPCVALEAMNQFGKSIGGPIVTAYITQISFR